MESFLSLAEEIGLSGASITVPHKEAVLPYLAAKSEVVSSIGACNTIVRPSGSNDGQGSQRWQGYNTDAQGFTDSLLEFTRLKDLRGKKICIIGAGGMARAVASEVSRLKGKALILNRTVPRARDVAAPYRFAWGGLDMENLKLMEKYTDIIIQATSVGMEPDIDSDPLWFYKFSGKEQLIDLVYKPAKSRCLIRAEEAGCKVLNGYDMLMRQARYQYEYFLGKEFPSSLVDRLEL
jgi:3-dehydroquinate dehydratase/shikimate dehydrogenase